MLSSWRDSLQEPDYEQLLTVRTMMANEAKLITQVAGENAARLRHIQALLVDATAQRFADRVIVDFFAHTIEVAAKLHDSAMGVRDRLLLLHRVG